MGINHLLLAMALFNLVVSTRSMDDSISQILQEQKKRYCGKFLADTLATLCKGNYQTIIPGEQDNYCNLPIFIRTIYI